MTQDKSNDNILKISTTFGNQNFIWEIKATNFVNQSDKFCKSKQQILEIKATWFRESKFHLRNQSNNKFGNQSDKFWKSKFHSRTWSNDKILEIRNLLKNQTIKFCKSKNYLWNQKLHKINQSVKFSKSKYKTY